MEQAQETPRDVSAGRLPPGRGPAALPRPGCTPASLEPGRLTGKRILVHTHLVTGV